MTLRQQLLGVSLLLLALPWAGCQFVREMESTLRDAQAAAIAATADAIAASLRDQPGLLYTEPGRLGDASDASDSLYAHSGEGTVIVDGYAEDWEGIPRSQRDAGDLRVRYAARERDQSLYLLLEVTDPSTRYAAAPGSGDITADRVLLRGFSSGRDTVLITTSAPGRVRGIAAGGNLAPLDAQRVRGVWQDTASGYTLELELPLVLAGSRLGFSVVDGGEQTDTARAGTLPASSRAPAPWLVRQSQGLSRQLRRFAAPGTGIEVTDRQRFLVGAARGTTAHDNRPGETPFWLLRVLYRAILADTPLAPLPPPVAGRLDDGLTRSALSGESASRWYASGSGRDGAQVVATAPVFLGGNPIGSVRVLQGSENYLALADRAVGRILGITLLVLAVVIAGLVGYASLLGWRIARLGRAAAAVTDRRGAITRSFPRSRARDEIGDLSRRFADLLDEVERYNHYLSQLARRLGHELRTPIAIIQSSLDNLEQDGLQDQPRDTYLRRAREGLQRLSGIVSAMSEASRLEESIAASAPERVELTALLTALASAYEDACQRQVSVSGSGGPVQVDIAPDCLVQALDKLVDNANAFATPGSAVAIDLKVASDEVQIGVSNQGPLLDPTIAERLFQPMVSTRAQGSDESTHLGLGLHIVQLVARHYGGRAEAHNLPDGSGVRFTLTLPRERGTPAIAERPAA